MPRMSKIEKFAAIRRDLAARMSGRAIEEKYRVGRRMVSAATAKTQTEPWGGWQPPVFEVVAHAGLGVTIPGNSHGYVGRSHSLWYCDAQEAGRFQWFETAFMLSPFSRQMTSRAPFARPPGVEAAKALWRGMAEFQVAWPFTALVVDDLGDFIGRWAGWLAAGSQGALSHPSQLPERSPQGSWRQ